MSNKTYETNYMSLSISPKGTITSLIDKSSGQEYLVKGPESLFATLTIKGQEQRAVLQLENNFLKASFLEEAVVATFQIMCGEGYIVFRLLGINRHDFERLEMANLKVSITKTAASHLNGCYDKDFLVAVMPLGLEVNSDLDAENSEYTGLKVRCFPRFGIMGAQFAIVGCPPDKFLDIADKLEERFNLPRMVKSLRSESAHKSYLAVGGGVSEQHTDTFIRYVKKGGFGTVMFGCWDWLYRPGHYNIPAQNFPDGILVLKRMVDRFHQSGIEVGFHNLSHCIDYKDDYVHNPSPHLYVQGRHVLAEDIDEKTDTIPIFTHSPETLKNVPVVSQTADREERDNIVRIGREIIRFGRLEGPPYRLVGCTRGHSPTNHMKGEIIDRLKLLFNGWYLLYSPDFDSPLAGEIAQRLANVLNFCEADFIYSDYAERSQGWVPGGGPTHLNELEEGNWYYTTKFLLDLYNRIENKNVVFQTSLWAAGSGFAWHLSPRSCFMNGEKDIGKHIRKRLSAPFEIRDNFKIPEIGACGIPEDTRYYTASDFEYICKKMIGFEGTLFAGATLKVLNERPDIEEIFDTIGRYHKMQRENKFSEEEKERFRRGETEV